MCGQKVTLTSQTITTENISYPLLSKSSTAVSLTVVSSLQSIQQVEGPPLTPLYLGLVLHTDFSHPIGSTLFIWPRTQHDRWDEETGRTDFYVVFFVVRLTQPPSLQAGKMCVQDICFLYVWVQKRCTWGGGRGGFIRKTHCSTSVCRSLLLYHRSLTHSTFKNHSRFKPTNQIQLDQIFGLVNVLVHTNFCATLKNWETSRTKFPKLL